MEGGYGDRAAEYWRDNLGCDDPLVGSPPGVGTQGWVACQDKDRTKSRRIDCRAYGTALCLHGQGKKKGARR